MSGTVHELDREVGEVVGRLRAAYADLLGTLPRGAETAIEVERSLGVSKKLAWQVYRVATAREPLSAGARVPGIAAARQLVRAARKVGVSSDVTDRLEEATRSFHDTVRRHADDRSSFDLMVSAMTGDGIAARDLDLKRTAYRANRQLIGKYCDVDLYTLLVHPGERPGTVHLCSLRGLAGLHRLRPRVQLEISRHRFDWGDGRVQRREAIDETEDESRIALLRDFCSEPIPTIRQVECADGFVRSFAETESLGLRSATTCFLADVTRSTPLTGAGGDEGAAVGHIHEVATPARVLLHDVLIDERVLGDASPELRVLASRRDAGAWPGDDPSVLLPVRERVERIGRGSRAAATLELSRYPAMIDHVVRRLGWDAERLLLFRARIEFPVLHSVVWMRFDLG